MRERLTRDREAYERRFPYQAILTCGFGGDHINIAACFVGPPDTELEVRNGSEYGLYKVYELTRVGRQTSKGLILDLESTFEISAQNSSDAVTLGLVVLDRNNKILYQRQVGQFGVVRFGN